MKAILEPIIAVGVVVGLVLGALNYFATAHDLEMVQLRLEQKVVSDQLFDTQKQAWALEERNRAHGSDCSRWPDDRDREQYRKLKSQLDELQKKQDRLIKK